jgi:hypothetical protein
MGKVVDIYDRERQAAKCLGMTLRAFLERKAVLLRQAEEVKRLLKQTEKAGEQWK